jgi:hypothetical protein
MNIVTPAQAGVHLKIKVWIGKSRCSYHNACSHSRGPAFAGMTITLNVSYKMTGFIIH